jgi:hypothetical protein
MTRKYTPPRFESRASFRAYRAKLAALIGVEPSEIDDWTTEDFMRSVITWRAMIAKETGPY